ncbi:hypothetical protein SELMODRAFT_419660 [Selaginella moellendorffii]|uniref:Uncharacterized protein n=1 Tax=Selaginella moellendorffii TaxID=88036 RepID=D8S9M3_SELML|nr:hypothetical protein SELMODRAFT_419660 [Selaginella moellendorffii]
MAKVTLDSLPLKRVLALEESGIELYPPESSQDEKPLSLLQSLDFERPDEKEAKKSKSGKDGASQWPWQGLIEHFHQAREELMTLLDFIAHVESNEALTVTHMMKPKPLPNEAGADLALRTASKSRSYKEIASYLKRNAKSLERQVERESVFYGALMRLQRNWKIKRQRGVSAGPGGKAGFLMDLSFPLSVDPSLISSSRTAAWTLIKVNQDANGLLSVQIPAGKTITTLQVYLSRELEEYTSKQQLEQPPRRRDNRDPDEGTSSANHRLRNIQLSIFDELIFECLCRDVLQPSSATSLHEIGESSLDIGAGPSIASFFRLVEDDAANDAALKEVDVKRLPLAGSLRIYLQQGFYSMLLASIVQRSAPGPRAGTGKEEPANLLKNFSVLARHRSAGDKIVSLLDTLVLQVPQLWFRSHPTWRPFVSAWDVYFDIPEAIMNGGQMKHLEWNALVRETSATFQCTLVLRQEILSIEGLDGCMPLGASGQESTGMKSCVCSVSELPFFLLTQIAGKVIGWLEEEAVLLGPRVKRDFLSIVFNIQNNGLVSLVAAPSGYCINWWLRFYSFGSDDTAAASGASAPASERFLGPLPLETLRAVVQRVIFVSPAKLKIHCSTQLAGTPTWRFSLGAYVSVTWINRTDARWTPAYEQNAVGGGKVVGEEANANAATGHFGPRRRRNRKQGDINISISSKHNATDFN